MHAVETRELTHRFAAETVLKRIDLQVRTGTIYGFLGPNGAGKTTTLRLILGLLRQQAFAAIYVAKLLIILAMVVQLFVCFNLAIYLAGIVPALALSDVDLPGSPVPFGLFGRRNVSFFVDVLPIAGLQYVLALRFRNFMAPIGIGMAIWIIAIAALPWDYNYLVPYSHGVIDYTTTVQSRVKHALPVAAPVIAMGYFAIVTVTGYFLYALKGDKG